MTDILVIGSNEPNSHFTNFTKYYTMEDNKGGFDPNKSRLNSLEKSGNGFNPLSKSDQSKIWGSGDRINNQDSGNSKPIVEGDKWNTPNGTGSLTPN